MGLKCPKCGTDNLLTAIFCRGCGDKLDLNAMKPEALLNDEHSMKKNQGATKGQKIFVGVFFGILGLIVLLVMIPVGANGLEEGEADKSLADAFAKVNKMRGGGAPSAPSMSKKKGSKKASKKAAARLTEITLDSNTASKLLSGAMALPKEDWTQGPFVPQHFSVDFREENNIKVVVKAKAFGMVPVTCSANAKLEKGENGYEYILSGPKVGMLPMIVYGASVTDLIQALATSCPATQAIKAGSEITTSEGNLTVKF